MANQMEPWRGRNRGHWPSSSLSNNFERMFREFEDFFSGSPFTGVPVSASGQEPRPAVELQETDKDYILSFDVPGVKKEDIDIDVTGNNLIVRGERHESGREGRSSYREQRYGSFERVLTLPNDIDASKVEAEYDNGVLTVMIPKSTASQRQKIAVKSGSSLLERAKETIEAGAEKAKEAMGKGKKDSEHVQVKS